MPEISRFYGIVVKMYFGDHPPPHFHAEYAEDTEVIEIRTLAIISGSLPPRAMGLVAEWRCFTAMNSWSYGNVRKNSNHFTRLIHFRSHGS